MNRMGILAGLGLLWASSGSAAADGPRVHAITGARVVLEPGKVLERGTIVLRDGVIAAVGRDVPIPADARIWDFEGRTIYPGCIEVFHEIGGEKPAAGAGERSEARPEGRGARRPESTPSRGALHENSRVRPEFDTSAVLGDFTELRQAGFAVAHVVPASGIWRGQSSVVALRAGSGDARVLRARQAQVLSLERDNVEWGSRRPPEYPSSVMGSVALARQTLLDADWTQRARSVYETASGAIDRPPLNESLLALSTVLPDHGEQPVWMLAPDGLTAMRVDRLAREFQLDAVLVGVPDAYRFLDDLRAARRRLVLSVEFPEPPACETDDEALAVEFTDLQHWVLAPENPKRVHDAGIAFAVTAHGLKKPGTIWARLRKAVERGLPRDVALAAVTTHAAAWLGIERDAGRIAAGKAGHLTITDGDLFDDSTRILEVWVDGERFEIPDRKRDGFERVRGAWKLVVGSGESGREVTLEIQGTDWAPQLEITPAPAAPPSARWSQGELVARFGNETLRLRPVRKSLAGRWSKPGGGEAVEGTRVAKADEAGNEAESPRPRAKEEKPRKEDDAVRPSAALAAWPPLPPPAPPAVLVRGATVWTGGPQGTLAQADVLAVGGKIRAVGPNLTPPKGAVVVEARGQHLTPGLIDCHSHSNILGGVNEATNTCTAEVRIADVLNSESVALYRELAGGLTVANQLHGSANAIGGQNAVIKLRWGKKPDGLLLEGAPPGIKFALGENPKQSNWDARTDRYPQTRMGVEQAIRERFLAARDYMRTWDEYGKRKDRRAVPPRRDLQLEAVAEILRGQRLVHCHSYRADEILMMTRLAEEFGFRIGTFQHVLEGYKVANELAAHGAGASSFSDWWAYKFEVYDAIPHNGALMHERGVVVSFNSDSAELARHLNVEAAKAVKYGGVPDAEALQFVTLNPALQLGIASRVGSLEPGKDADFVLWSGDPLSPESRCEQTWIEGRRYFDRATDVAARAALEEQRRAWIEKARRARKDAKGDDDGAGSGRPTYFEVEDHSCHAEVGGQP